MAIDPKYYGYLTLFLLFLVVSFVVYKYIFVNKLARKSNPFYKKVYKISRKTHPIFASIAIILGSFHGFLMLGELTFHTGSLIIISLFYMLLTFLAGKTKYFRTKWRSFHKPGALITIVAIFIHLYSPGLI